MISNKRHVSSSSSNQRAWMVHLEALTALPLLQHIPTSLLDLIAQYTVSLLKMGEWEEAQDNWSHAFFFFCNSLLHEQEEEKGGGVAAYKVGMCFMFGLNVVKVDLGCAISLLKLAEKRACQFAASLLADCLYDFANDYYDHTGAQSARARATDCYGIVAFNQHHLSQKPLAQVYDALHQMSRFADDGDVRAQWEYGRYLMSSTPGSGGRPYLEAAARRGNVRAILSLYKTMPLRSSPRSSPQIIEAALTQGCTSAASLLASSFGASSPPLNDADRNMFLQSLHRAATTQSCARYRLLTMYLYGVCWVAVDAAKATEWENALPATIFTLEEVNSLVRAMVSLHRSTTNHSRISPWA